MSISLAPHTGAPAPGRAPARTAAPRRPAARTTLYSRASAGGATAPRRPAARITESVESMSGTRCIMPQGRGNFKVSGSEGQVVRALGGIASATLLSRLLGFVRDMIVARAFGAGPVTDAFFVAFRIPNILRRLLAEGALSTAMIPVFTDYASTRERPELTRMLRAVLGLALLVLTVTAALGILGAPLILNVIARITGLLLPAVFGLAAVQLMVFVNTLLASLLPLGSISYLYYADRVMEFPLGVFGIALASASLPVMSRQAAAQDHPALAATLSFALRLALYVSVPATVGLVVLRTPFGRGLFERGRFGPVETSATAEALAWYALGLAGFAGSRIVAQAFYALGDAATAVRWGIVSIVANVVAALAPMGPLGHPGPPGPAALGAYVTFVAPLVIRRGRLGPLGRGPLVSQGRLKTPGVAS